MWSHYSTSSYTLNCCGNGNCADNWPHVHCLSYWRLNITLQCMTFKCIPTSLRMTCSGPFKCFLLHKKHLWTADHYIAALLCLKLLFQLEAMLWPHSSEVKGQEAKQTTNNWPLRAVSDTHFTFISGEKKAGIVLEPLSFALWSHFSSVQLPSYSGGF